MHDGSGHYLILIACITFTTKIVNCLLRWPSSNGGARFSWSRVVHHVSVFMSLQIVKARVK
jgi:hypothetical protein